MAQSQLHISPQTLFDNLELLARQAVEGFIIGLHKSPFHGFSVEFAEHRPYNAGDPLRHVDWRVYGRTEKLFVKRFEEETNLRCCLMIDTSSSMMFPGDPEQLNKLQFACFAAAALLQLLRRQLDASALALFDESVHYLSECRSAHSHYRNLSLRLEQLLHQKAEQKITHASTALHQIAEQIHRRSLVVIFSDMMEQDEDADALFSALQHLRYNKHEVILFHIVDGKQELDFEFENRPYEFVDLETGEQTRLQPAQMAAQYRQAMADWQQQLSDKCHQYGIDRVAVDLRQDVNAVLHAFLLKRARMS
ncbi:MAG: DUF58 domain-containing protein [Bacteroidetes bacterium]|nr:DUF58 domain-containing protein [Bacteroidota bacterium]